MKRTLCFGSLMVELVLAAGCAQPTPAPRSSLSSKVQPPARTTAHELAALRNYSDLVRAAALHDGTSQAGSPCLLSAEPAYALRAEINAAVRPLPLPSLDLEAALNANDTVNILTAFGRYGERATDLTFAAFTQAPPSHDAQLIVLTDHDAYLRATRPGMPVADRLPITATVALARSAAPSTVYVAAEAEVPLAELAALLTLLANETRTVAFAVNLAPGTRLPERAPSDDAPLCPEGLPATAEPEGTLSAAQLREALSTLRTRASACLDNADASGAAGGAVTLAFRVLETGEAASACVARDDTGDPRLRACLVHAVASLPFPSPTPRGVVDLMLPLMLRTEHPAAPAPLCGHHAR